MSLITRNNYEAYLLDYIEKNLSSELIAELMLFLDKNPDLKDELDDFKIYELKPVGIRSFDKSVLKKESLTITLSNYEDFIIAEVEGDNSIRNSAALKLFLKQNPIINKEFLAYQKTKLVASTIRFENKKVLKKKSGVVVFLNWMSSSAAAVVIFLFLLNWFSKKDPVYSPLSEKVEFNIEASDFNQNILAGSIIIKEEELVIVEKDILKHEKNKKKQQIIENVILKERAEDQNKYAELPQEKEIINVDSKTQKEEIIIDEEILFSDNSVTITYEDELLDNGTPNLVKRRITKLDLVRAAVKHQVSGNLNKGKEKVLFALNSRPLNFLRKNKK